MVRLLYKRQNKRMRKSNEQPLGALLREMVETYRLKSRLDQTKIQLIWQEVMGSAIARYTTELTLRKGKLYVSISSATLRQELSYGREKIRRNLNEMMEEEVIGEVVIR